MRQLVIVLAVLCATRVIAQAAEPAPKSDIAKLKSDIVNEAAIRKLYDEFTAAWNRHDVAAMTSHWAEDGDHVEPDGQVAKGRDQVTALFTKQHASIFKDSHLELKIDTVWFITQDVALIDGTYDLSGVVLPDGTKIPDRTGRLSTNLLNEQGRWWIVASRLMIPATLPYKPKPAAAQ
ncbi:MAG TPA: SgcJ/EcaC family oxidoreductase [Candidatus Binatia bacterium]|nr:SgcJ/EcaC family oxidoreductase [Candidatus Binatia bacterium]